MSDISKRSLITALVCALSIALALLLAAVLPVALYQYFGIETPEGLGDASGLAWATFLAPIRLFPFEAPNLGSTDPLVTLVPTFALMFCIWSLVIFGVILLLRRARARPDTSLERSRER